MKPRGGRFGRIERISKRAITALAHSVSNDFLTAKAISMALKNASEVIGTDGRIDREYIETVLIKCRIYVERQHSICLKGKLLSMETK